LTKIKVINPNDQHEKFLAKGLIALQKNNYQLALKHFKSLPENTAKNSLLKHYHIGLAYTNLNKLDEALEHYRKITEIPNDEGLLIDKTLYSFYINTGSVLQVLGRRKKHKEFLKEAIECYKYSLQIKDDDAAVWNNLANCHLDLKEYVSAHKNFDRAIEINKMFPQAHFAKSVAYKEQEFLIPAIDQLKIAYALNVKLKSESNKTSIYYLKQLVALLFSQKELNEAKKYAELYAKSAPKSLESHKFLSLILYNMANYTEAYKHYEEMLKIDTKFKDPELEPIFKDLKDRIKK